MLSLAGYASKQRQQSSCELAQGDMQFVQLANGLRVHGCDVIESDNAQSSAEVSAGLSFVVLFEGRVNFSLGNKKHRFVSDGQVRCFANLFGQNEIFTRYMQQHQRVKKLVIWADKHWLQKRCQTHCEKQQVGNLFSQTSQAIPIAFQSRHLQMARTLFELMFAEHNLVQHMQMECWALSLLEALMPDLFAQQVSTKLKTQPNEGDFSQIAWQDMLDKVANMAERGMNVRQVATQLNISSSTLQRRFKQNMQMSVQEYVRMMRLEKARNAMLVEGVSIGEAAYNAGYRHTANFVTAFKKQFAVTPAQLRRLHFREHCS